MADRRDSTGDLATVDVPTLVVVAERDALIPPAITLAMASDIPGARVERLPVGHLANLEAPADFNRLLAEHRQRCVNLGG